MYGLIDMNEHEITNLNKNPSLDYESLYPHFLLLLCLSICINLSFMYSFLIKNGYSIVAHQDYVLVIYCLIWKS